MVSQKDRALIWHTLAPWLSTLPLVTYPEVATLCLTLLAWYFERLVEEKFRKVTPGLYVIYELVTVP